MAKPLPGEWTLEGGLPFTPKVLKTLVTQAQTHHPVFRGVRPRGACLPIGLLWGGELVGESKVPPEARRLAQLGDAFSA